MLQSLSMNLSIEHKGTLSVVATPIGNLEDITLRALRILKECDMVACEDTRTTKKLLAKYDIHTPTISYHSHSGEAKIEKILTLLEEGKHIALVTDAGTPAVSDPGSFLVEKARESGARIEAIPGASALTSALSISGIHAHDFIFLGFLPQKKGRKTALEIVRSEKRVVILYESTHRILKLMNELAGRKVMIIKEITKMHEATFSGIAEEIKERFEREAELQKGEFVVIVSPQ